jgi:hypothetical protein
MGGRRRSDHGRKCPYRIDPTPSEADPPASRRTRDRAGAGERRSAPVEASRPYRAAQRAACVVRAHHLARGSPGFHLCVDDVPPVVELMQEAARAHETTIRAHAMPTARPAITSATPARNKAAGTPYRHSFRDRRDMHRAWRHADPEAMGCRAHFALRLVRTGPRSWSTSRPGYASPGQCRSRALRLGPHGGTTTASWGFVRMAAPPRSSDNRGMLRGAPALRSARASSHDDVGGWTARSTIEAALLVEHSANCRAGARA